MLKSPRSIALCSPKERTIVLLRFQERREMNLAVLVLIVTQISSFIKIPWQVPCFSPLRLSSLDRIRSTRPPARPEVRVSARTHNSRNFYSAARNGCATERRANCCSVIPNAHAFDVWVTREISLSPWRTRERKGILVAEKHRVRRWGVQLGAKRTRLPTHSHRRCLPDSIDKTHSTDKKNQN